MEVSICDSDCWFLPVSVFCLLLRHMVETHHPASPPCHILVCEVLVKWIPFPFFPLLPFLGQLWPESPLFIYSRFLSTWRVEIARLSDPSLSFSIGGPCCQSQAMLYGSGRLWNPQGLATFIVCVGTCRSLYRTHVSHEYPLNKTIIWII